MSTRNVPVADTRFFLREHGGGEGTPVLLLHGVPETSAAWKDIGPALAKGRRVLAPDLPGLGGSSYSGPFDVASVVTQIVALLDAEFPGQRVDVVGHDFGTSIALGLAGAHPDRVRRLAVSNGVYRHINLLKAFHIPLLTLPLAPEVVFKLGGKHVVDVMLDYPWKSEHVQLDPEVRAEYTAAYTEPGHVSAMLGYYRAAARPKIAAALQRTKLANPPKVDCERMLVFWGAKDPVLPISVGESIVKDLGAACDMVTIPGAGHFVLEEATDVVIETLLAFLADETPKPAPAKRARAAKKAAPPETA